MVLLLTINFLKLVSFHILFGPAHATHLTISDVLYEKKKKVSITLIVLSGISEDDSDISDKEEVDGNSNEHDQIAVTSPSVRDVVSNVKNVCKTFTSHPVENE